MKIRILGVLIVACSICAVTPLSANIAITPGAVIKVPSGPQVDNAPLFRYATPEVWKYLRRGLSYLESPKPLLPPEAVPPSYIHPDSKGFGAYGFSPGAYEDVRHFYPYFRQYSWNEIMKSSRLYDLGNQAFADWLIGNLQDYISADASAQEIFDVVHRAWNLGLTGYKKGRVVVSSRIKRAGEFLGADIRDIAG